MNRHNVRILGSKNPYAILEHERNSPMVNVQRVPRMLSALFSTVKKTVTRIIDFGMLHIFLILNIKEKIQGDFHFSTG